MGASSLTRPELWATIIGFTVIYGALAVVEAGLIIRTIRRGPYAHATDPVPDLPTRFNAPRPGGLPAPAPAE
jgi:cytochrome d ubiquinol oxidase subunit I